MKAAHNVMTPLRAVACTARRPGRGVDTCAAVSLPRSRDMAYAHARGSTHGPLAISIDIVGTQPTFPTEALYLCYKQP